MNTLRLEVGRGRDKALITRDRMRVDVWRVPCARPGSRRDDCCGAAQTLGQGTMQPDRAARTGSRVRLLTRSHHRGGDDRTEESDEKRGEAVKRVRNVVAEDLLENGLELRDGVALHPARSDGHGVLQPVQCLRRRGCSTRLTEQIERRQEDPQRYRAGYRGRIRGLESRHRAAGLEIDRAPEHAAAAHRSRTSRRSAPPSARSVARERADRIRRRSRHRSRRAAIEQGLYRLRAGASRSNASPARTRRGTRRSHAVSHDRAGRAGAQRGDRRAIEGAIGGAGRCRPCPGDRGDGKMSAFLRHRPRWRNGERASSRIGAQQEAEREALRGCRLPLRPSGNTAAERSRVLRARAGRGRCRCRRRSGALASRIRFEVDAEGARLMNEAQKLCAGPPTPLGRADAPRSSEARCHHSRVGEAHGAHRRQQDPARRWSGRWRWRGSGPRRSGRYRRRFWTASSYSALRSRAQAPLIDQLLRDDRVEAA